MNFRGRTWRKRSDLQLELTPLIDIIFLLLLFFLSTTTFVQQTRHETAIIISLPKGKMGVSVKEVEKVTVVISQEGNVYISDEKTPLTDDELRGRLEALYEETPDALIEIKADEMAYHGVVTRVLDIVDEVGFDSIGVGLEQDE